MKTIVTDALVIGGGLAGLRSAIGIKRRGHDVIVLSLVPPKRSHSAAAQGGMQASLANSFKGQGDNEDIHFEDTVKGSDWGADQDVVRMFVNTAPKAIRELAAWGVPWNRVQAGEHTAIIDGKPVSIEEQPSAHGLITSRNFGGTKKWRTCYVSDGTGHSMLYTMSNQAIAENIPVHERKEAISLLHENNRCYGAIVRCLITGELICYIAKATCIATGGFGRIYKTSTNAIINEGIGAAIALETGVAPLANMEAVQFHPTAIFPAGILVTEGCRGDGGLLLDKNLHRFMPDYEPEKKELASRDVVARWMETHIKKGFGVTSRFGEHLWLDIRLLGEKHINTKLREVKEICQYFLGIDPAKELIPVRPAQHYSMGGIRTNYKGESPSLAGLFSAGESACWDMHGFNRLGGNSVAETVVAGMIVGEYMADYLSSSRSALNVNSVDVESAYKAQCEYLASFDNREGYNVYQLQEEMQNIMTDCVGIFRNGETLQSGLNRLRTLQTKVKQVNVDAHRKGTNLQLIAAYRLDKMVKLAICTTQGALLREESRGAHHRDDFPIRNDKDWLKRTLVTWNNESGNPEFSYEALTISNMELPPNWRGYGSSKRIEHPDTAARQQEVDKINQTYTNRFERQVKLMPYEDKLPEPFKGKNQRLGES